MNPTYFAHATAVIDAGAVIGAGSKIWHFAHVSSGARIGERCIFGQNTFVADGVVIGNNVKVQNNVAIYTGTTTEDDVFLGPSCVLTNVTNPRSQINRHGLYEQTLIRRGATIGANATIVCGITLGRYAFIAAGAVVTRDVPDYALICGVPGRRIGWMSRHGHLLAHPNREGIMLCPESGMRYKLVESVGEGADVEASARLKCLDLDEEEALPPALTVSKRSYDKYKMASREGGGRSE